MVTELSLAVVGAPYPNADGSDRAFEIRLCAPGEAVALIREPKNRFDPNAIAVFSARGVQIGYLTAERAPWIGAKLSEGWPVRAVFQKRMEFGAVVRANLEGREPVLPSESEAAAVPLRSLPVNARDRGDESGFWPDPIWDD